MYNASLISYHKLTYYSQRVPSRSENLLECETYWSICFMDGKGLWSLNDTLLRFPNSIHNLSSPFFFMTRTKFDTQLVCLIRNIIPLLMILKTSFCIKGSNFGLTILCFYLIGLELDSNSIICWERCGSKLLSSAYPQAKTSLNSWKSWM